MSFQMTPENVCMDDADAT